MSTNRIVTSSDGYVCYSCLNMSKTKNICSHCGKPIDNTDLNCAILTPPRTVLGAIETATQSEREIIDAISRVSQKYFDTFDVEKNGSLIKVTANEIAFERLISEIGSTLGMTAKEALKLFTITKIA